jgi:hypothetical protein
MNMKMFPTALNAAGGLVLSCSLLILAPQDASAVPAGALMQQASNAATTNYLTKVDDDDWHSRWRSHARHASHEDWEHGWHGRWSSHRRWGSEYEHNRWRSHNRWGSWGTDYHNRWRSHHRWGSED